MNKLRILYLCLIVVLAIIGFSTIKLYALAIPLAPTNFTATVVGNDLQLDWVKGVDADDTIIIRSDENFPTSLSDGDLIYYGGGITYTTIGGGNSETRYYYSAWSRNVLGDSVSYATTESGGGNMTAVYSLLILSLGLLATGYGFNKSYLKIASFPFFLALGIYISYNYTWFGEAQWTFILMGFLVGVPLLLDVLHREARKTVVDEDEDTGEIDEIDKENDRDYKNYRKKSTKPQKRNKSFAFFKD